MESIFNSAIRTSPPLDIQTAFLILDLDPAKQQKDPKAALHRYYQLFKKNDPANGGSVYMQSKVFAAKETIMNQYPNAVELEQQFYKEFVEPEEKAEQEKNGKTNKKIDNDTHPDLGTK